MPAILIALVGALIGAGVMSYIFRELRYRPQTGAWVGAVGGVVGALLFTLPLNFCMFTPAPDGAIYEIDTIDQVFGFLLIALGMVVVLGVVGAIARWWQGRTSPLNNLDNLQQSAFKNRWLAAVLLAPTIAILALFLYYPSLDTLRLSTLLAKLGVRRTAFVCVDNFTNIFLDPSYLRSIITTFFIAIAIVVIGMSLSLLIATMVQQPIKGARFYRVLLIWPYAISPAVAGIIFVLMFNPAGGIINHFLGARIGWLNDPAVAPWSVIIASVWKSLGFNILFYIAGLQNVPKDLQEAAAIDGANAWQRFRNVVIPLLSPITFFLVITNLTYAFFETFATIDKITPGGGPLESNMTLMYRVYKVGIIENDLGKGAAQSIVLFLLVIAVTVYQFRSSGSRVNYGA